MKHSGIVSFFIAMGYIFVIPVLMFFVVKFIYNFIIGFVKEWNREDFRGNIYE